MLEQLQPLRETLRQAVEHGEMNPRQLSELRRTAGASLASLVADSTRLQSKAVAKLGAGLWWCTERSLAQATPHPVAELKAGWMSGDDLWDLCCGIGGDAVALARRTRGRVVAVDRDSLVASMAAENLRLNVGRSERNWEVRDADVTKLSLPPACLIHLDPDRREDGKRTTRPENYMPPWAEVTRLMQRCAGGLIKLAPVAAPEPTIAAHRIWISLAGSVREQTLMFGKTIDHAQRDLGESLSPDRRTAIVLRDGRERGVFFGSPDAKIADLDHPLDYLVDPDAAIRAAGLTAAFAERFSLHTLGGPAGFLTGIDAADAALAISERVIWSGSPDDRKLRKTLRSLDAFPWRVKTRGVAHNPNELERRYRKCGQRPVTLWIGKTSQRHYAVLTQQ